MTSTETVSAPVARRLLLHAQGLLADPARPATSSRVYQQIERLGFVQVDTINVIERAHEHILLSRFDGYRPSTLARLLEHERVLFEHWTHDAAIIPTRWFAHWRPRFGEYRERWHPERSHWAKRLGAEPRKTIARVKRRIRREGPLRSADFEQQAPRHGTFWNWKPEKTALEYLWRTGELAISRRENFQKLYDLTERVLPDAVGEKRPTRARHVEWACRTALERLAIATPTELRDFLYAARIPEIRAWCEKAARRGEIAVVRVEPCDGSKPYAAYAMLDWQEQARRLADPPDRTRLLSPFDPALHDRKRTKRLFGFDYTLECFVPPGKRRYGYFCLPVLAGERLVARADAKLHRDRDLLELRSVWWEKGVDVRCERPALRAASEQLASQIGATDILLPRKTARA